jgi:hypothetical protein
MIVLLDPIVTVSLVPPVKVRVAVPTAAMLPPSGMLGAAKACARAYCGIRTPAAIAAAAQESIKALRLFVSLRGDATTTDDIICNSMATSEW